MSRELTPVPTSVSTPLRTLFDRADLRAGRLDAVLPSLDLTPDELGNTHIHFSHRPLYSETKRVVKGQCVKILPGDATLEKQNERARYIEYLVPGLEREGVENTTFVLLDLPGIAMLEHFKFGKAQQEASNVLAAKTPDILDIEKAVCRDASRVLMHELLHVPIALHPSVSLSEESEVRDREEAYIDEKLQELDGGGIPTRLVNLKFRHEFDFEALFLTLAQIARHRGQTRR